MNNFLRTLYLRVSYDIQNKGQFASLTLQMAVLSSWRGNVFHARQELHFF